MASYYSGPTLTAEQVAQVAYQAGVRGNDLVFLTAVAKRESGYVTGAHRTDSQRSRLSGDRGLWQINSTWDSELKRAGIINSAQDLFDPVTNAKAAAFVLGKQGRGAWGMGANGWAAGGDPNRGINMSVAQGAVTRAQSQGLLGKDWNSGGTAAASATGSGGLPRDARIVRLNGGPLRAVFQIMPGVHTWYSVSASQAAGKPVENVTTTQYNSRFGLSAPGGDASELAEIPAAFGTYANYVNAILDQVFPKNDPRRQDAEVMRVLATRAGRPDMTEAEFENLLKGTKYYQTRTEGQLRWNDLSEAERQLQRQDVEARMMQTVLGLVGQQPSRVAGTGGGFIHNKTIKTYIDQVASGKMGFAQWTEQVLKPFAAQYAESPWSRQLREEQENQRARPIDIENTVLQVRDTLTQWGLQWSEATITQWARGLVEKTKSDDDLLATVKQSAAVLYPWKDPEMETMVAAAPWIETYNRVLERQGSLQTPEIMRVMSAYGHDPDNNDPWSFEQKLKMTDQYDQTRQGADDAYSTAAELAGMMGF
jgi:hypothetical protein